MPSSGPTGAQLFQDTRWSVISRAKEDSLGALNVLCEAYRRPLLVWCRKRGDPESLAEDHVQGFLSHLLSHRALRSVGREKGRFRTFLLTSFQNFLRDQLRRANAEKRGGGCPTEPLDDATGVAGPVADAANHALTPDLAFDRAWAEALLDLALRRLHDECATSGRVLLAQRLEAVLFEDPTAPSYELVATEFGMTAGAVKTAVYRMRKRLRTLIREELVKTLADESEWQDELAYLQRLFVAPGQNR
ncbi:MAG: hypothetical protein IT581_02115 [Verrucomicrobiales bacterium]|nr:hypothetical protein [Verrucomicrobiales bacterium]